MADRDFKFSVLPAATQEYTKRELEILKNHEELLSNFQESDKDLLNLNIEQANNIDEYVQVRKQLLSRVPVTVLGDIIETLHPFDTAKMRALNSIIDEGHLFRTQLNASWSNDVLMMGLQSLATAVYNVTNNANIVTEKILKMKNYTTEKKVENGDDEFSSSSNKAALPFPGANDLPRVKENMDRVGAALQQTKGGAVVEKFLTAIFK